MAGTRFGQKKDVYILTSKDTFSATEGLSYTLKNLKRATLIGETTGGGAHPGDFIRLNAHFNVFVPNGRSICPITKTDWEGTGVVPDVSVAAADALKTAQTLALKKLMALEKNPHKLERLASRLTEIERGGTGGTAH